MNSVVHFEIPASDMDRAKEFYETVFGWDTQPYGAEYILAYTGPVDAKHMPKKLGAINGAIQKKDKSIASTRVVIDVANIDKAIANVVAAGGKLKQPKTEVPKMLFYAVVIDTEGNEVGLAQPFMK
jgi:uncharacterized protein